MFQRPNGSTAGFLRIGGSEYPITRDGMRAAFDEHLGGRADQLTVLDVKMLASLLGEELCRNALKEVGEGSSALEMWVDDVCTERESGPVDAFHILVDGPYFSRREGISLEPSGFIGFAGWADSCNERPFLCAFARWLDEWLFSPCWRNLGGDGD